MAKPKSIKPNIFYGLFCFETDTGKQWRILKPTLKPLDVPETAITWHSLWERFAPAPSPWIHWFDDAEDEEPSAFERALSYLQRFCTMIEQVDA